MSDHLPLGPATGDGAGPQAAGVSPWRTRHRRASVTLRRESGAEEIGSLMDPATQSLSDALRITYRFVQFAVIALAAFYILSGFRRVNEGERGMRLLFGRVVSDDIDPGFRFSWPEPFGELVKVGTGAQPIAIDDDFFPQLTAEEKKAFKDTGAQALASGGYDKLNPEVDGSVVTGDGAIAHTRWAVTYHRDAPKLVEENIDPDSEKQIVTAACKRGIVRAVASVSIDELLKNFPDKSRKADWHPVESVAKEIAQRTLDSMESGIRIDLLSLTAKIPPRRVMTYFNQVQSSFSEANKMKDEAGQYRKQKLLEACGEAADAVLEQIALYDKAIELNKQDDAAQILDRIDHLMAGDPVTIDGNIVSGKAYGKVQSILADALREARTYQAQLAGEVDVFNAKLDNYRKNALVLVNSEWADAYAAVLARPNLESVVLPSIGPDGRFVITTNRDPEIQKNIIAAIQRKKAEDAEIERRRLQEKARFEAPVGPVITGHD